MHHVADYVISHCCFRRGDSDVNESMHWATEKCYNLANKIIDQVTVQLPKLRTATERLEQALEIDHNGQTDQSANDGGSIDERNLEAPTVDTTVSPSSLALYILTVLGELQDVVSIVPISSIAASIAGNSVAAHQSPGLGDMLERTYSYTL